VELPRYSYHRDEGWLVTTNSQVFAKDPMSDTIPNSGVSKVQQPENDSQWRVLRYELTSFVCSGEYERGLDKILGSYLSHLSQSEQPAVWVSGFYGSGKSHLVRVLEYLWTNTPLPDSAEPRGLATLPAPVSNLLTELTTSARRTGVGPWAAAGNLGAGAKDQIEVAFASILHLAAGLPSSMGPARCALWLHREGLYDTVRDHLVEAGRTVERELNDLYVSPYLAEAILAARPEQAADVFALHEQLTAQFRDEAPRTDEGLFDHIRAVLEYVSGTPGTIPLTLIVLDEVQQYINEDGTKALAIMNLVEGCSSRFDSRVLVVATGQSELLAAPVLQKLTDRFTVSVQLKDQDVDDVVRQVVLRKNAAHLDELTATLDASSGEIARQISSSKIGHKDADRAVWAADYPLLPSRRRFWERVLREADRGGKAGQLRSQLRVVHEAARAVAAEPLGTVVPADFLYDDKSTDMVGSGVLLGDVQRRIESERSHGMTGVLRARVLAMVFLISLLPNEGLNDSGVRATKDHIADLLVDDLSTSGDRLRRDVPAVLDALVAEGALQRIGSGEHRMQTPEGQEWDQDFRSRRTAFGSDAGALQAARDDLLRAAVSAALPSHVSQGVTKESRRLLLSFGDTEPEVVDGIPVWVRSGWDVSLKEFESSTLQQSEDSPLISVYLIKTRADDLRRELANLLAADETLQVRALPETAEGKQAWQAMRSRRDLARGAVQEVIDQVIADGVVRQAGGTRADQTTLRDRVVHAAGRAAARYFYRFGLADQPGWDQVQKRARDGDTGALEAVGYQGDVKGHPVAKLVLESLTSSWTTGATVEQRFSADPFGWSRDAVRGALLALAADGAVSAQINGHRAAVKDIVATAINKTAFRLETDVVPTKTRLAARKIVQDLRGSVTIGDEAGGVVALLAQLQALAEAVSGDAPLPRRVLAPAVASLIPLQGNALINAAVATEVALRQEYAALIQLTERKRPREQLLRVAEQLASRARETAGAGPAVIELDAVKAGRGLLDDVDPVSPVLRQLADALRAALQAKEAGYESARRRTVTELESGLSWTQLTDDQRRTVLSAAGLAPLPPAGLGTPSDVLAALTQMPLTAWDDRIESLVAKQQKAASVVVSILTPKAVAVATLHRVIGSTDELDDYLDELRAHLTEQLTQHGTIAI
jgi:hypothetical protein